MVFESSLIIFVKCYYRKIADRVVLDRRVISLNWEEKLKLEF